MLTVADLISKQNILKPDAIDFLFVKDQKASPSAFSTVFFGEELLTGLRESEGYLQAQTLLTLLKSANTLVDFNFVYYCLKNKPALTLTIERMRPDRYRLTVQSQVDDWSDDWFFFFKEDGAQFDPDAVREITNFS